MGKVFHYRDILTAKMEVRDLEKGDIEHELKRLHRAIQQVQSELITMTENVTKDIDSEHGQIFEVHRTILDDPQLLQDLETVKVSLSAYHEAGKDLTEIMH